MDLHRIPDDLSIPEFLRREPRLPTPAEMDEMAGRAFAEAFRELREEDERKAHRPQTALEQAAYWDRVQEQGLDEMIRKQEGERGIR